MKPTFRPVVYAHHKRKDGTYNVKICVYLNGKERKLPTTLYCTKADLTRTHHIKSQDILNKCNVLISRMHGVIADIPVFELADKSVDWLVSRIKSKLTAEDFRLDFFAFAGDFLRGMDAGTAETYRTALNAFKRYLKRDYIDINEITKSLLAGFAEFVDNEPKVCKNWKTGAIVKSKKAKRKGLASVLYVSRLGAIFKAAKAKYNDEDEDVVVIPRSPFDRFSHVIATCEGQEALPPELVQALISHDQHIHITGRKALDAAIVSFGLMGINMADLWEARPPKDGVLVYNRCKTRGRRPDKAEMQVRVPAQLEPFLARLGAGTDKDVWLPELRLIAPTRKVLSVRINYHIGRWCEAVGVERFTTYALRKAWATMARGTGADKSLVDECIGHTGEFEMTDIYASRPWGKMAELNAKVLGMFQWE